MHSTNCEEIKEMILFPGVTLSHMTLAGEEIRVCHHASSPEVMEINYCHRGRIGWNMKNGQCIYLGPGDFSINTQTLCAESVMTLPNGSYEGLSLALDMKEARLPALLTEAGISLPAICASLCPGDGFSVLTGNEKTAPIFEGFYVEEEAYKRAYCSLKTMELLLHLSRQRAGDGLQQNRYQSEQVEIIKSIHDYLVEHMEQRITIGMLADRFPLNTTTIKSVFKAVYGESIAAHIREHRLEKAAELLTTTDLSIAEIARAIGYNNQSKFSASFQSAYQMLPLEYRRLHH
ncbi:MAG: helix-turn-helix transcriptional regulator [Muribaculaceae bacterium]|nr:helix-turn-helix transcriptional regulator [Roseburia sp.]MCM1432266.1 helix-turn-helix transcriptional regulator [Muribaculaceae bacterium]MCM1493995.1 helix-turn-helix transcriptional regulator [Muribaculaceae bacterium]MCM1561056.1 helix-turn-helix transcriptional regulator [Butyrivibrio sp.]